MCVYSETIGASKNLLLVAAGIEEGMKCFI